MKRKSFAILLATILLVQVFCVSAFAFDVKLDQATKKVTVIGDYPAGSQVSVLSAYNATPSFLNADYINQYSASAFSGEGVTFPAKDITWLGGEYYAVSVNGVAVEAPIYATDLKVASPIRVSIKTGKTTDLGVVVDAVKYDDAHPNGWEVGSSNGQIASVTIFEKKDGTLSAELSAGKIGTAMVKISVPVVGGSRKSVNIAVTVLP